jgi:hypothetical protein
MEYYAKAISMEYKVDHTWARFPRGRKVEACAPLSPRPRLASAQPIPAQSALPIRDDDEQRNGTLWNPVGYHCPAHDGSRMPQDRAEITL